MAAAMHSSSTSARSMGRCSSLADPFCRQLVAKPDPPPPPRASRNCTPSSCAPWFESRRVHHAIPRFSSQKRVATRPRRNLATTGRASSSCTPTRCSSQRPPPSTFSVGRAKPSCRPTRPTHPRCRSRRPCCWWAWAWRALASLGSADAATEPRVARTGRAISEFAPAPLSGNSSRGLPEEPAPCVALAFGR